MVKNDNIVQSKLVYIDYFCVYKTYDLANISKKIRLISRLYKKLKIPFKARE